MRLFVLVITISFLLLGASGCEPGRGQVQVVNRIDETNGANPANEANEASEGLDGGPGSEDCGVDVEPDSPDAAPVEEDSGSPRIPIPNLDEEPTTRISIHRGKRSVTVTGKKLGINGAHGRESIEIDWSEGALVLRGGAGEALPDGTRITAEGEITLHKVGSYPGSLLLFHNKSHMLIVNEVPLERYVQSVVQSEVPSSWTAEVHKAQAVAARTYALARMALQSGQYSLESSVMDQVYRAHRLDKGIVDAVTATRGEVLASENGLIETKYHSTCGGQTENPDEVWPELDMRHQWSVSCGTCTKSPHYRWSLSLTFTELKQRLGKVQSGLKRVKAIKVIQKSRANRALLLEVQTEKGAFTLTGRSFRRAVSLRKVRSTFFEILPRPRGIKLVGRGFGHGVGMCQWGASGMAESGHSYTEILKRYYSGAVIHKAYE